MNYQPLHHKYRPQTFAELVGQEAIATTLTNALRQQRIAPAYLFTGARGTGKTSSARILAKSLNCLNSAVPTEKPCGQCEVCRMIATGSALDVIEIDAASNTGVDNIRELIERAQFAPVQCRYKVYIIDEVHMLSTAAFNALLKTLEEPPHHVVFVLATTDPQRVLATIISRCQRFDFRRIPLAAMVTHLKTIAGQEHIAITDAALTLVAQLSQGGLRDAESLLDQLSLLPGEVTAGQVWDLVGSVPEQDLMGLLQAIAADDAETLLDSTRRLLERGREPLIVLQNLASFYRDLLIAKTAPDRSDLVALTPPTWERLCDFAQQLNVAVILKGQQHLRSGEAQVKHTTQPRLWLEVTLMGLLPSAQISHLVEQTPVPVAAVKQPQSPLPSSPPPVATAVAALPNPPAPAQPTVKVMSEEVMPEPEPALSSVSSDTLSLDQLWQTALAHVQPPSTQMLMRQQAYLMACNDAEARVGIINQWHKTAKAKIPTLEAAFEQTLNRSVKVHLDPISAAELKTAKDRAPQSAPAAIAGTSSLPQPPQAKIPANHITFNSKAPQADHSPQAIANSVTVSPASGAGAATVSSHPLEASEKGDIAVSDWQQEDEVTRAAKRLADFFAGQIVDLSDSESGGGALPTAEGAITPLQENSSDDWPDSDDSDEDVPF
ncbi:MAG TPA: DNA polymerase III subunit gamma/tau [Coleofasciculaceae cyanobacterium]